VDLVSLEIPHFVEIVGMQLSIELDLLRRLQFLQLFRREVDGELFGMNGSRHDMEDMEFGLKGFGQLEGIGEGPMRIF
jgi:hypothetical protein